MPNQQNSLLLSFVIPLILSSLFYIAQSQASSDNNYKVFFTETTKTHISAVAKYMGAEKHYRFGNNPRLLVLNITILFQTATEFKVLITDRLHKRWQIPEQEPYPHDNFSCYSVNEELLYRVEINKSPFGLKVIRKSTEEVLFDTLSFPFILSDRYLEFSSYLPTQDIFGLGERVSDFKLRFPGLYTIWARDLPSRIDDLTSGALNTYGMYPLYLQREKQGFFHLVYLRNSNGMDIRLDKQGEVPYINYIVVGGVIDLKFFLSSTKSPEEAVRQYHKYIGKYMLQPFWSFGYHQCRWGYKTWSQLEGVVKKFHEAGMPLDAIWMDIDYMVGHRIFTIDESRYNLNEMQQKLKDVYHKRLVLILDPGVKIDGGYHPYNVGLQRDIYIKHANGQPIRGSVWPGDVYFPDFFNPEGQKYWKDMLAILYDKVKFDGIWLDMNELSNFVNGAVGISCDYPDGNYYSVYNPGHQSLDAKAVCLNALHYDGSIEYNVHHFNGLMETIATYDYLKDTLKQRQPFILSRSTVPGSGKYTTHWTGDNVSTFEWMRLAIAGLLNFNIFGIPNVGADICGFDQWTTEELCIRWMQVGTLYPFSRNHNHLNSRDQDPFSFGEGLRKTSMVTIKFRYSILKYYYYLFVRNQGTGTVMRPLFFEFPEENDCFSSSVLEEEFLLGDALLVTPVLNSGRTDIEPYFPGGLSTKWFDILTGKSYVGSAKHQISNDLSSIAPVFLRSGFSIHRQNVENVNRTEDLSNEIYFSVAFRDLGSNNLHSRGQFMACENYNDYDKLEKCIDGDCLINVDFIASKNDSFYGIIINLHANNQTQTNYDTVKLLGLDIYGAQLFDSYQGGEIHAEIQEIDAQNISLSSGKGELTWKSRDQIKELRFAKSVEIKKELSIAIKFN